ncbi:MAG: DUF6273 domain-containing protein, partial [Acutalibacteraceae bacterium]
MKKTIKRMLVCALVVVIMSLTAVPLGELAGLNLGVKVYASNYQTGDVIEFGSYPQSNVTDEALLAELSEQPLVWVSYNYYSADSDGYAVSGNWMKYADVTYNGNQYRAVRFTKYRPAFTRETNNIKSSYQDENGYYINTTYWFEYEPIKWRVIDSKSGLIMSEVILDSQPYNNSLFGSNKNDNYGYGYRDFRRTVYANNYVLSSIRKWLNEDFYNTAFTMSQKLNINTTDLDNSAYPGYSKYNCESTNDKIFLMSHLELTNRAYGFSTNGNESDSARLAKKVSNYAKCQGYNYSSSYSGYRWILRSPGIESACVGYVDGFGKIG